MLILAVRSGKKPGPGESGVCDNFKPQAAPGKIGDQNMGRA